MIEKIKQSFIAMFCTIRKFWEECNEQQVYIEEYRRKSSYAAHSLQIPMDLYEAFRDGHYACLKNIQAPVNIRYEGIEFKNGAPLYKYRLPKLDINESIPTTILNMIQVNMNKDIATTQHSLIYTYGYDYVSNFFPYLYNGVYIMALKDVGAEVELVVALNW